MEDRLAELPEFRDWSIAAVRLLQGVVYHDEEVNWDRILKHRSTIESYFGRLGLLLVGELVARMDGVFTIDARPGGGTRAVVELPAPCPPM